MDKQLRKMIDESLRTHIGSPVSDGLMQALHYEKDEYEMRVRAAGADLEQCLRLLQEVSSYIGSPLSAEMNEDGISINTSLGAYKVNVYQIGASLVLTTDGPGIGPTCGVLLDQEPETPHSERTVGVLERAWGRFQRYTSVGRIVDRFAYVDTDQHPISDRVLTDQRLQQVSTTLIALIQFAAFREAVWRSGNATGAE